MNNKLRYLIFFVTVPVLYILVKVLFSDSEARTVYAFLSAWWYSLYLFKLLNVELSEWKHVTIMCFCHAFISHIFEYKDFTWGFDMLYIIVLATLLLHLSPYFINLSVNYLMRKFFPKLIEEK